MKKSKTYILSVPDDIYTIHLEDFIIQKLGMDLSATGMGTTEFESNKKPRRLKERILKNFGTSVWNRIYFTDGCYED